MNLNVQLTLPHSLGYLQMASGKRGNAASRKKAKRKRGTAAKIKPSMKLLVDTKAQRVLYAEAGKDVVDFLFSLLTLPLGTVAGLLTPAGSMFGSVGNLHTSIDRLDESYMCRDDAKAALLAPTGGKLLQLVPAAGFVQGVLTYTVMDDLKVAPMSNISGIKLLKSFGINDIASLQEKIVELGHAEALKILTASLRSKTVLTDVFLGKKTRRNGKSWKCSAMKLLLELSGDVVLGLGRGARGTGALSLAPLVVRAFPAASLANLYSVPDSLLAGATKLHLDRVLVNLKRK